VDFYDPGQLNRLVTIQAQPAGGTDSFTAPTWSTVATVWASIKPAKSAEPTAADRMQQSVTHTVLVRWSPALAVPLDSAQWRVSYTEPRTAAARLLAIVGPGRDVAGKGRWLIFDCVEGLTDGN
jgi:head-tail adaptor